jgi:hypothetical protein
MMARCCRIYSFATCHQVTAVSAQFAVIVLNCNACPGQGCATLYYGNCCCAPADIATAACLTLLAIPSSLCLQNPCHSACKALVTLLGKPLSLCLQKPTHTACNPPLCCAVALRLSASSSHHETAHMPPAVLCALPYYLCCCCSSADVSGTPLSLSLSFCLQTSCIISHLIAHMPPAAALLFALPCCCSARRCLRLPHLSCCC